VLVDKVLILELLPIDGLSSSPIEVREIASLQHELGDNPVED